MQCIFLSLVSMGFVLCVARLTGHVFDVWLAHAMLGKCVSSCLTYEVQNDCYLLLTASSWQYPAFKDTYIYPLHKLKLWPRRCSTKSQTEADMSHRGKWLERYLMCSFSFMNPTLCVHPQAIRGRRSTCYRASDSYCGVNNLCLKGLYCL